MKNILGILRGPAILAVIGLLLGVGLVQDVNAQDVTVLVESDPNGEGEIAARFFSLTDSPYLGTDGYAELHHNRAGNNINWPVRPDEVCGSSGPSGQNYKSMPWLPQSPPGWLDEWGLDSDEYDNRTEPWNNTNPDVANGDFFNLSGDCQSSPTDGGTNWAPFGGRDRGAWLHKDAFGGWTDVDDLPLGFTDGACRTEGNDIDTSQFDPPYDDFPRMWSGFCQRDEYENHGPDLFRLNGYSGWSAPGNYILTTSGVAVFRHTFELSAETIENIKNSDDAHLELDAIVDDWMQVYLNGEYIFGTEQAIAGRNYTEEGLAAGDVVNEGPNVLAIQAVDKAAWHAGDGSASEPNAAGLAYRLQIRGELDDPEPDPDPDPEPGETTVELDTDTMTPNRLARPGDNITIRAYVENQEEMENEHPGDPPPRPQACDEDPESQECQNWQDDMEEWEQQLQDYEDEREEKTSEPVTLRVHARTDRFRINPNQRETNVGRLEPGQREERNFSFSVEDDAQEADHICFQSEADEEGYGNEWGSDPGTCVYVARNFDMQPEVNAPSGPEDELTGTWSVRARIENTRLESRDGMATDDQHNYEIDATMEVLDRNLVEPLTNPRSFRKNAPASPSTGYSITWNYSGSGSRVFQPQPTFDHDIISADTRVTEGAVEGRDQVCFRVTIQPTRYRDWLPSGYENPGGIIDTNRSSSDVDCTDLWQVDRPYVTTEDGDVHGGAVQVDPDTAEHCENDGQDVHGQRRGSSPQGSKSTYAVAATGGITRFGSRDSTASNILQFGNNPPGNYRAVCRPDLTDQEYYENLGFNIEFASTRNLNNIINRVNNGNIPNDSVVFANHPSLSHDPSIGDVTLEAGKRVTIVRVGGTNNIEVRGDISVEGGDRSETDDIPALALVAAGDIDINSGVDSIEAYISSNGTVDTCADVTDITDRGVAPQCQDQLEIRGALLAQEIRFRRTYGDAGNTEAAETIVFTPWLYLSPPPGIFGVTNNIFTERPVWERLPFF